MVREYHIFLQTERIQSTTVVTYNIECVIVCGHTCTRSSRSEDPLCGWSTGAADDSARCGAVFARPGAFRITRWRKESTGLKIWITRLLFIHELSQNSIFYLSIIYFVLQTSQLQTRFSRKKLVNRYDREVTKYIEEQATCDMALPSTSSLDIECRRSLASSTHRIPINKIGRTLNSRWQMLLPSRSAFATHDVHVTVPLLLTLHDAQLVPQAVTNKIRNRANGRTA